MLKIAVKQSTLDDIKQALAKQGAATQYVDEGDGRVLIHMPDVVLVPEGQDQIGDTQTSNVYSHDKCRFVYCPHVSLCKQSAEGCALLP